MKRSPIGRRAVERRQAGGKRAVGRDSLSSKGYEALRAMLLVRSMGTDGPPRCEACGNFKITGEIEHAVPRSQGGADSWDNCWITCRLCALRKEASAMSAEGRLRVTPLGEGEFLFEIIHGQKWSGYQVAASWRGGRKPTDSEILALEKIA